jgi:hypothetical protein
MASGVGTAVEKFTRAAGMSAMNAERTGSVKELATAVMQLAFALQTIGLSHDTLEDLLLEIKKKV